MVKTGKKIYYKDYLAKTSTQIYAGYNPSTAGDAYFNTEPIVNGYTGTSASPNYTKIAVGDGLWGQKCTRHKTTVV